MTKFVWVSLLSLLLLLLALCSVLVSISPGTFSFVQCFPISPLSFKCVTGPGTKAKTHILTQNIISCAVTEESVSRPMKCERVRSDWGRICNDCWLSLLWLLRGEDNKGWRLTVGSALADLNTKSLMWCCELWYCIVGPVVSSVVDLWQQFSSMEEKQSGAKWRTMLWWWHFLYFY